MNIKTKGLQGRIVRWAIMDLTKHAPCHQDKSP